MSPVSEEPGSGDALPSVPPLPSLEDHAEEKQQPEPENGEACLAASEGAGEPPLLTGVDVIPGSPFEEEEEERLDKKGAEAPGEPPEGGWGWVVMLASMWCNGAVFGIQNSCGVLFKRMLTKFGDPDDPQLVFRTDMGTKAEKAIYPRLTNEYVVET